MTLMIQVVCTANVCRSPMAAALLQRYCDELSYDAQVRSAGVKAHDLPVDPDAVEVMAEMGLDISAHQPRQLDRDTLDGAQLVITMTRDHLRAVAAMAQGALRRTFTAKELAARLQELDRLDGLDLDALNHGRSRRDLLGDSLTDGVADPYGLSLQLHRKCAAELDDAMRVIAHALAGAQP